ncbi:MAG: hypothetical protein KDA24_10190 [Deltaproteobacteria bacterium]|nr:hypothetical protein [Deltaproteobacteria bacterium]
MLRHTISSAVLTLGLGLFGLGCPGSISADGVDGFTVNSAQWMTYTTGGARRHELVATSVSDYCTKRQNAEAERQAAFEAFQQRIADGVTQCEAWDAWYDDIANAFNPLDNANASYLRATLTREVESNDTDAITAPAAGHYVQLGGGGDGTFIASIQHHVGRFNQELADAWDCEELDESELDDLTALTMLLGQTTATVDYPENFELSAAELDIVETSSSKREVDISGDILDQGSTVGGVRADFTATQCEVEMADELSF